MDRAKLLANLADKEAEVEDLRAQLGHARQQTETCRRELEEAGTADTSSPTLVPSAMQAGKIIADTQHMELRQLMQWLAITIDLSQQVMFDCGAGKELMQVGGKSVNMQRMVAWQLVPSDGLKLSVPVGLQAEVATLLAEAQARGRFSESTFQRFADSWEMVSAEVASALGVVEPAIFLVCRETSEAMVCARWPMVDFAGPARPCVNAFDPAYHFSGVSVLPSIHERRLFATWSSGDRVEVQWEGEWFAGALQWVQGDIATVKCDVDEPGVTTDACITLVRPAAAQPLETARERPLPQAEELCGVASPHRAASIRGHVRAKSIG